MTLLSKAKRTIAEHELLASDDSVLVALSGGPDSVALLRVLVLLRKSFRLSVAAVYVNHMIRVRAAKKEAEFCQELCDRHGVDLTIVTEDIPALAAKVRRGVEETAREFRYGLFNQLADEDGHDRIALGHHADDKAETVLFRVIRGTGVEGLASIPIKRGRIIRPLLHSTKAEILAWLKELKQDYCEDVSNRSVEYSRNFIRNRLLPQIRDRLNPQVDLALVSLAEIAEQENSELDRMVMGAVKKLVSVSPGGKFALDLRNYRAYDKWLRFRTLRYCLKAISERKVPPDRETVERLDRFCLEGGKGLSLPDAVQAVTVADAAVLYRKERRTYCRMLSAGKSLRLEWPKVRFRSSVGAAGGGSVKVGPRSRTVTLDYDRVEPPLEIRNIRRGDRFRPLGMRGSKKVGDYLTDKKVARVYRDEIPVLCDSEGIIWLVGHEIADRVKVNRATRRILKVEYVVRKQSPTGQV